ncbi:hypothetical protein GTP23_16970 [Pseudoduganella sp. FT93W]|uniref:Uncharacterized protein n=1 Tax=Duganella fentianensis TaxID=2692177 RepID=A0A845I0I1_9BURK|nr:hypothetical protein [Duganella fentianensis]MYN46739.1 hypothetical protein [Duganella fentianensis]
MRLPLPLLILPCILCLQPANAGTQVLGVEIGVTTSDQLSKNLSRSTDLSDRGINKYSGGKMLATDGSAYQIEGLTEVVYIFDSVGKLAGVIMDMDKGRFASVYQYLQSKYKVKATQLPYVGDQFARFEPADAIIELDAPHLSFTMQLRYIRNDLSQKYKTDKAAERAAKKKAESAQF